MIDPSKIRERWDDVPRGKAKWDWGWLESESEGVFEAYVNAPDDIAALLPLAEAGLKIARLMASTAEWDSDTLDAVAQVLDDGGLAELCPTCGLFKVPDEPCVNDEQHAEAVRRAWSSA